MTSPSDTTGFSAIRRARPSYSCRTCRSRRVRCDKVKPSCGNCRRNSSHCVYPSVEASSSSIGDGDNNNIQKRRRIADNSAEQERAESGDVRTGYLVLQPGGRSRYTESSFWACVDAQHLDLNGILPNLPLFPSEPRSAGVTAPPSSTQPTSNPTLASAIVNDKVDGAKDTGLQALDSVIECFPDESTCELLFQAYVTNVHPLIPMLHLPRFERHYQDFWRWRNNRDHRSLRTASLTNNLSMLPLIGGVLYAGTFGLQGTSTLIGRLTTETIGRLRQAIPRALATSGFPQNPSLHSLVAFILFNSMMIREEEAFSSCSFVAMAIRVAQSMGLHRDGTHFELDPVSIEERRRVWWHLMHLDTMSSIMSGLPLVASRSYFDTLPIGELKDTVIGSKSPSLYSNIGALDTNYSLAAGRYEISDCMRYILDAQNSAGSLSSDLISDLENRVDQVQTRITARIASVDTFASFNDAASHSPVDKRNNTRQDGVTTTESASLTSSPPRRMSDSGEASKAWNKKLLRLTCEKAYCILYQPVMQDSSIWKTTRPKAIPHFQNYLITFLEMCDPAFEAFQWLYPGSYQPLQACAVLLVDLSRYSGSKEAIKSRELIDRIFALTTSRGRFGVDFAGRHPSVMHKFRASPGARQVWVVLEKLRWKVWIQLGFDPSVYWNGDIDVDHQRSPSDPLHYWVEGNMGLAAHSDTTGMQTGPFSPSHQDGLTGGARIPLSLNEAQSPAPQRESAPMDSQPPDHGEYPDFELLFSSLPGLPQGAFETPTVGDNTDHPTFLSGQDGAQHSLPDPALGNSRPWQGEDQGDIWSLLFPGVNND